MSDEQIRTLELTIDQAKEKINLLRSIERLKHDRDFIAVVLKGYFEDEAVRLVHAKGNPAMESKEMQDSIIKQMDAIGSFNNYLRTLVHAGQMAEKAIEDDSRTREELLAEELSA